MEGGKHNLTYGYDDVLRHVLADFLDRPQHCCKHLPQMWAQDPELQDEITRVKASFNEQVCGRRAQGGPCHSAAPAGWAASPRGPTMERSSPINPCRIPLPAVCVHTGTLPA